MLTHSLQRTGTARKDVFTVAYTLQERTNWKVGKKQNKTEQTAFYT